MRSDALGAYTLLGWWAEIKRCYWRWGGGCGCGQGANTAMRPIAGMPGASSWEGRVTGAGSQALG